MLVSTSMHGPTTCNTLTSIGHSATACACPIESAPLPKQGVFGKISMDVVSFSRVLGCCKSSRHLSAKLPHFRSPMQLQYTALSRRLCKDITSLPGPALKQVPEWPLTGEETCDAASGHSLGQQEP
eukprot:5537266-Amphidinium_carterae.1